MNPLQGIRGVPVTLSPLKAVAQTPAAPIIGPTVSDQVVLDGSSLAPPPPPPLPVEEQQSTPLPAAPPQQPAPVKANVPNEVGGFLIAGAAPQAPAEPQWEDKTNPDGSTFKQRMIESEDGGPKWREILFEGHPPYQMRSVKAEDGGPNWVQKRFPGQANRPGYRQRNVPSTDGGPVWLEKQIDGKTAQKTREVPATDGGKPWNEVAYPTGGSWKSRKATAEDGGNEWTEIVKNGTLTRSRTKAAEDGKGDWNEVHSATGHRLSRTYKEDGLEWRESINGSNRFRSPAEGVAGLAKAGAEIGTTTINLDGQEIKVHGGATPRELDMLRAAIQAMPPGARVYAQDITLADNLGEALGPNGESKSDVGGLAAGGQIALNRNYLKNQYSTNRLVFHESGHVADTQNLNLSSRPPWGQESSVTIYGQSNQKEDFAETHRVVLFDFERYSSMSAAEWACESQAEKKMQIARLYSGAVPTSEEVRAAETDETKRQRDLMARTDAITQGSESGKVALAEDGGPPWTEYRQDDKVTGRSRKVASSDGGPGWTEFQLDGAKPFKQRELVAGDGGPNWVEKLYDGGAHSKFRFIPSEDGGPKWTERLQDNGSKYKERTLKAEDGGPSWQETHFEGRKPYKKRTVPAEDGGPKWAEYQFEGSAPYKQREVPSTDGGAAWKQLQFPDKPLRAERPVASKDGGPAWTEVRSDGRRFLKRQVVEGGVKFNEHWENGKMVRNQA